MANNQFELTLRSTNPNNLFENCDFLISRIRKRIEPNLNLLNDGELRTYEMAVSERRLIEVMNQGRAESVKRSIQFALNQIQYLGYMAYNVGVFIYSISNNFNNSEYRDTLYEAFGEKLEGYVLYQDNCRLSLGASVKQYFGDYNVNVLNISTIT